MSIYVLLFIIGYIFIVSEQFTKIDKAVPALLTGMLSWMILFAASSDIDVTQQALSEHLSSISEILLFLIGAMTIVELIDAHKGFLSIRKMILFRNPLVFVVAICFMTFFLSSVLDNLTTTLIMCSVISKIVKEYSTRMLIVGMVVIAANSGGVWSPIGDVTSTMLWIGHKFSAEALILHTFIPSLLSLLVPLILLLVFWKSLRNLNLDRQNSEDEMIYKSSKPILIIGLFLFLLVPVLKTILNIPPYMAMMFSLAVIWVVSEWIDPQQFPSRFIDKKELSIRHALSKIEMTSILFFLGILLAVAALEQSGALHEMTNGLRNSFNDPNHLAIGLGILSSLVDNVPLVAASMQMFDFPFNNHFWFILSFCAGTGGSLLIIGSAAGVAAMGIEKIKFWWYFKNLSLLALSGYLAGVIYLLLI